MFKKILIISLVLVIVVLTIQNYEVVELKLFFWSFSASRALVIFATFVIGLVLGWTTTKILNPNKKIQRNDSNAE